MVEPLAEWPRLPITHIVDEGLLVFSLYIGKHIEPKLYAPSNLKSVTFVFSEKKPRDNTKKWISESASGVATAGSY